MGLLGAIQDPQFRKDVARGLLDAGNRGAVAGLLGAPVDTAALVMGLLGYKNEAPVGGSEWIGQKMQNAGFVSPERNRLAEALAGVAIPAAANRLAPTLFAAEQKAAQNLAAPNRMNAATRGQAGAIVWHGSPHKFDKFDSSKIGTGEGAQAYGHGLYLAESPDVATRYRDTLTNFRPDHIEAKLVEAGISPEFANTYSRFAAKTKGGARGLDDFAELMSKPGPSPYIEQFRQRIRAELPAARAAGNSIGGSLYKVDLPDDQIARMLDWDKPLSQQPEAVRVALKDFGLPPTATGKDAYNALSQQARDIAIMRGQNAQTTLGASQAGASNDLLGFGIPGIRYLDGGSRGAGTGSSNFVVFPGNENLLRILERNGQALP